VCSAVPRIARQHGPFHFAFLDPPYGKGLAVACLNAVAAVADDLLAPDAVLVVESDGSEDLPEEVGAWHFSDDRRYGQTCLGIYRPREATT